jgi:hypothetical protein
MALSSLATCGAVSEGVFAVIAAESSVGVQDAASAVSRPGGVEDRCASTKFSADRQPSPILNTTLVVVEVVVGMLWGVVVHAVRSSAIPARDTILCRRTTFEW